MGDFECVSDYQIQEELGKGSFSVVHKCTHRPTGQQFAMKIIDKSVVCIDQKNQKRLRTEVEILTKVSHPNIIPLKDLRESPKYLFLVMELVDGGELFDKIVEKGWYSERDAAQVIKQTVSAIDYLHGLCIAHRDLKPENLLVKKGDDTHIMISDFGLSRILGESSMMMSTACGTPYYVAPEVVKAVSYTKEVDMWSVGVITYFLLAGFPPFMGDSLKVIVEQIMNAQYDFPSPYWDEISPEAKDFVRKLLVIEPEQRMTPAQALNHPWLQKQFPENVKPLNNTEVMAKHNTLRKKQYSF